MSDRDPIDALRDAWNELTPPAPDQDATTDALVEDLRAAWNQVEAPLADPGDLQLALQRRARVRVWRDRATLVAAASLLIALILVASGGTAGQRRTGEELAVGSPTPTDVEVAPQVADPRVRKLNPEIRARALEDGTLELKHGRVRLLLGGQSNTVFESHESAAQPAANAEEESK